jgi:hypothetical protein
VSSAGSEPGNWNVTSTRYPFFWGGGFISLFSCLRRHADALYRIKATNVVTSLRLRSSADIVKRSKNQSKNQKSRTPCNRHSAQSFRFYVFDMFRCDSPYRGSVGTIIQSSPLIRPPLFYNGESVFANLANWSRRPVARMNRTVFGINSESLRKSTRYPILTGHEAL